VLPPATACVAEICGNQETEMCDVCGDASHIVADIELIRPDQIDRAFDRIKAKDVRYRFVIDLTAGRQS
jgi:uncharacterized zinc-type alcohol dehydrogenase-like protein